MSRYSVRYVVKIGFEIAFALYNVLMLAAIFLAFTSGEPDGAVILIFFVPLFVLDFLIVPVLIERDWPILKTKRFSTSPLVFIRSCLYFVSIISIITMFAASFLYA